MRLLIIEDYAPLLRSLSQGLSEQGYVVDEARDGHEGLARTQTSAYDVIILDLMLPGVDGLSILEQLRKREVTAAVLIVTARDALSDRVLGLDLGADDYLVKPFAFQELAARVRALIRRRYLVPGKVIRVEDLEIDLVARRVRRGERRIELSAREYALLEYLAARREQVVTRAEILEHVYDFATEPTSNVVDVYIGYLRRKIDSHGSSRLIHTRRGRGYQLGGSA